MKIALYSITLPYLIEMISILVIGSVKDYASVASHLLAYVYLIYAVRSIKLDAFLLIVHEQKSGEKHNHSDEHNNNGGSNT